MWKNTHWKYFSREDAPIHTDNGPILYYVNWQNQSKGDFKYFVRYPISNKWPFKQNRVFVMRK